MKDDDWKTIEEEKPDLFEEAVAGVVAKSDCDAHTGKPAKINSMVIYIDQITIFDLKIAI